MKFSRKILFCTAVIFLIQSSIIIGQDFQRCRTFSEETLAKIGQSCNRPHYTTTEYQIVKPHFIIHYTASEIPPVPTQPNMLPPDLTTHAYATKVANYAEDVWDYQCNFLGWNPPPSDGTCGENYDKYDIYIRYVNGFGLTNHENTGWDN